MSAVFFDESGFTGRALLDPAQPFFVIASSIIGDDDAALILGEAFPTFGGKEFKFKKIWNRPRYRKQLIKFCGAVGERLDDVYIWEVDKKFCVLTKMIDFLIEPVAHVAGHDFYKNAYAYKYANYIHFGLNYIGSPELYTSTVDAYYEFARDPNEATLVRLRYWLQLMTNSVSGELSFFFRTALTGAANFHDHSDITTFKDSMEIYVTSMLNCVGYWSGRVHGGFDLRHDRSDSFFAQKNLWDALTSKDVPEQWHPVANGPPIRFPLPVNSTQSLDSESSPAIQLCDLLAGLAAKFMSRSKDDDDQDVIDAIVATKFANVPVNGIVPRTDFPEGGPERLDGPDPVDRMVQIVRNGRPRV